MTHTWDKLQKENIHLKWEGMEDTQKVTKRSKWGRKSLLKCYLQVLKCLAEENPPLSYLALC